MDVENALALRALTAFFCEADAEITHAETLFAILTLQRSHPAGTGLGEPLNGGENLHGGLPRDSANIGFGLFGIRFTRRPYLHEPVP